MSHDIEHVDGIVGKEVTCCEVVTPVITLCRLLEQVVDALLEVKHIHLAVEIHIAHVVEEDGVERGGLVLRVGVGALGFIAAGTLPCAGTCHVEVVVTHIVQVEGAPVGLTLHADADVLGIGAGGRVVEDDAGQCREETRLCHVAQVNGRHDVGDGLVADVYVLDGLSQSWPDGAEAVLMHVEQLQGWQVISEGGDIAFEFVALQVEVFEGGAECLARCEPRFHLVGDVAVELDALHVNLLHLRQGEEADRCLVGVEVVDAGAGTHVDFLHMTVVPLHAEDVSGRFLHTLDELPVGFRATAAVACPSRFLLCPVVGLAVEVPEQCEVLIGNLLQVEGGDVVEGGRFVIRSFFKHQRNGVLATIHRRHACLVAFFVGIKDLIVAHTFEPIHIDGFGAACPVGFLVQAREVDEVLSQSLLFCWISLDGTVVFCIGCP